MITTRQGPLLQGEWRHRLVNGSYSDPRVRHLPARQGRVPEDGLPTPGYRELRGSIETSGQFRLDDRVGLGLGRHAAVATRPTSRTTALQMHVQTTDLLRSTPDYALSQLYLVGPRRPQLLRHAHDVFLRLLERRRSAQIPIIHPVMDYDYVFKNPILGGEVSFRSNLTSLSRDTAEFRSDHADRRDRQSVRSDHRRSRLQEYQQLPAARRSRHLHARCRRKPPGGARSSTLRPDVHAVRQLRADVAAMKIDTQPGVSNYITTGESNVARSMPTVGLEYRYPLHQRAVLGHADHRADRAADLPPERDQYRRLPNEDAQSFIFDDTNLFRVNKFSGWDRVEGGGRANVGVQYTAQFNQGGYVNVLFGQSYQLFGQNSFAVGGLTNTGLDSGLDKPTSPTTSRARPTSRTRPSPSPRASASTRATSRCSAPNSRPRRTSTAGPPRSCTATTPPSRRSAS